MQYYRLIAEELSYVVTPVNSAALHRKLYVETIIAEGLQATFKHNWAQILSFWIVIVENVLTNSMLSISEVAIAIIKATKADAFDTKSWYYRKFAIQAGYTIFDKGNKNQIKCDVDEKANDDEDDDEDNDVDMNKSLENWILPRIKTIVTSTDKRRAHMTITSEKTFLQIIGNDVSSIILNIDEFQTRQSLLVSDKNTAIVAFINSESNAATLKVNDVLKNCKMKLQKKDNFWYLEIKKIGEVVRFGKRSNRPKPVYYLQAINELYQ